MSTDTITSGGICYIAQIPDMCVGARGSHIGASNPAGYLNESGTVEYANPEAVYAIGKLATQIPGYNPTASTLALYNFNPSLLSGGSLSSGAVQYQIADDGSISGEGIVLSGGACADNYKPNASGGDYTLVAWIPAYFGSDNTGGWVGGGGFCSCNDVGSTAICASNYVIPGGGITSPPGIINTLIALTATPAAAAARGARGGGGSSGGEIGGCSVFIGAVVNAPAGGFGVGAVQSLSFTNDGSYVLSGARIPVVFPYIG